MSLNETPSGERTHIGFFGVRNAGKSSLVNAITSQQLSIVSDVAGTTTDPVKKAMELLPLGPVVIIDTPGFDDDGELGVKRIQKAASVLNTCDIAVLVIDSMTGPSDTDKELLDLINKRGIPRIIVNSKADISPSLPLRTDDDLKALKVSALTGEGIDDFKNALAALIPDRTGVRLAGDLVSPGELCLLVCPIDSSAPKGRLILPQQQTIRDLLDAGAIPVVCRDSELESVLFSHALRPSLVITDSQAFKTADALVPKDIPLTSFSILMARYKGFLDTAVKAVPVIRSLQDGDRILLAEGCTHHRQCNDIGTVKIPRWLREFSQKELSIETVSGNDFPEDLSPYRLIIHCGGCMLTENAVLMRMKRSESQQVAFTNYGIVIALMTGTLERALCLFPALLKELRA